jgi:hypothetical protein
VYQQPYSVLATNDVWDHLIFTFLDTSTKDKLYGTFTVPQNYVGTAAVIPIWSTTATSGNALWEFGYRTVGGDDTTSLDQAGTEEAPTVTDAAPGAANRRMTPSIAPTSANFAAGETVEFYLARDGSGADTIAAALQLHGLVFQFADA